MVGMLFKNLNKESRLLKHNLAIYLAIFRKGFSAKRNFTTAALAFRRDIIKLIAHKLVASKQL